MPVDPSTELSPLHLETLLSHLQGVRKSLHGQVACWPAHADRHPSLSIGVGKEGRILLTCHAGCEKCERTHPCPDSAIYRLINDSFLTRLLTVA